MILIVMGLFMWCGAHLYKRVAPEGRAKMGESARAVVTISTLTGLVLMVLGYRMAEGPYFWDRTPALTGINNLLMLFAVYLFAAAGAKTFLARKLRHPMLTGVKIWAVAHILVNGDLPSLILFGGLLAWAVAEVVLINRAEPEWLPPEPKPVTKEFIAPMIAVVVFVAIVFIHSYLGYPVFG